jgi:hypothetical protein
MRYYYSSLYKLNIVRFILSTIQVIKAANEMLKLMPHQIDMEAVKKYILIDTSPLSVVLLQEVRYLKLFVIFIYKMIIVL